MKTKNIHIAHILYPHLIESFRATALNGVTELLVFQCDFSATPNIVQHLQTQSNALCSPPL